MYDIVEITTCTQKLIEAVAVNVLMTVLKIARFITWIRSKDDHWHHALSLRVCQHRNRTRNPRWWWSMTSNTKDRITGDRKWSHASDAAASSAPPKSAPSSYADSKCWGLRLENPRKLTNDKNDFATQPMLDQSGWAAWKTRSIHARSWQQYWSRALDRHWLTKKLRSCRLVTGFGSFQTWWAHKWVLTIDGSQGNKIIIYPGNDNGQWLWANFQVKQPVRREDGPKKGGALPPGFLHLPGLEIVLPSNESKLGYWAQ